MDSQSFIKEMKAISDKLRSYLCKEVESELAFQEIIKIFNDTKALDNSHKLREIIHILACITSKNSFFVDNANKVLEYLLDSIKNIFSSEDLYSISFNCEYLLKFFLKQKMIIKNRLIVLELLKNNHYFFIENKSALKNNEKKESDEFDDEMDEEDKQIEKEYRQICEIIKKDLVNEFISYIEKNNLSFSDQIYDVDDIFVYITHEKIPMIEFAAECGSIQIFRYLLSKNLELKPILWNYAIKSNSLEIIQILAEKKVDPNFKVFNCDPYVALFIESYNNKCFRIANYIMNVFLKDKKIDKNILSIILPDHNYHFIPDDLSNIDNEELLFLLCKNDYAFLFNLYLNEIDVNLCQKLLIESIMARRIEIVRLLLSKPNIDINLYQTYILKKFFFSNDV